jgi:hypothetical protein
MNLIEPYHRIVYHFSPHGWLLSWIVTSLRRVTLQILHVWQFLQLLISRIVDWQYPKPQITIPVTTLTNPHTIPDHPCRNIYNSSHYLTIHVTKLLNPDTTWQFLSQHWQILTLPYNPCHNIVNNCHFLTISITTLTNPDNPCHNIDKFFYNLTIPVTWWSLSQHWQSLSVTTPDNPCHYIDNPCHYNGHPCYHLITPIPLFHTWQSLSTRHICLSAGTTVVRLPSKQSLNRLVSPARPRQRTDRTWLPRRGAGDPVAADRSGGTSSGKRVFEDASGRFGSGRLSWKNWDFYLFNQIWDNIPVQFYVFLKKNSYVGIKTFLYLLPD